MDTNQNHTNNSQGVASASMVGMEEEQPMMEEPAVFVDMQTAVEVEVDDKDVPMEEEEEVAPSETTTTAVVDMSKAKLESHTGPVYAVAAHYENANNKLVLLSGGGDDKSFLHHVVPGNAPSSLLLPHAHSDTVSCVALNHAFVSEDLEKTPKLAAVGGYDGAIVLYDADTGNKVKELEGPSDVEWLCFHPKGGSVLLAGSVSDGTIWMYHIPTSKCLQVFVGHESGVTAGAFTPDGKWALSASSDGTMRVWAPRTGVSKHVFRCGEAGITTLAVNGGPDGQLVVVGAEDGQAHVCHVGTKKVVASLRHFEPPLVSSNREEEDLELPMSVEAVGFASAAVNPNWLATGGVDGVVKIWDLANDGQCRQICRQQAQAESDAGGITRLQWHPTLPLVFTSLSDGTVRVWDARNGLLIKTLTGHSDMINDLDVCFIEPENEGGTAVIVSGSDDKTVRIYEMNVKDALLEAARRAAAGDGSS